jgi:tetratricopeptide (TPR) repeat protein
LNNFSFRHVSLILICLSASFIYACSAQKENASSKRIQNLTARYNYLYNANVILEDYASKLYTTYADNYNDILPVILSPQKFNPAVLQTGISDKALDEVISKAQTIIRDKSSSNYIDDAYLLLGKSQFYKGNYFLAAEYFRYVSDTYRSNQTAVVMALDWQARSYMQLNDFKSAAVTLDTLEQQLDSTKKNRAEPYATLAQMAIVLKQPKTAIPYLQAALAESTNKAYAFRWHFILAQLYEQQQTFDQALVHYRKVQSSNTGFELYFNAKLKQVKLNAQLKGTKVSREQQLLSLLKDEKNLDFSDQIYYQIAEHFREQQNTPQALRYYERASNVSTNNYLKGLAYLQLADLNFSALRNYNQSKKYYDSALLALPKSYTGYDLISKKSQSLEYLSSRYNLISAQDTLQVLTKLSEQERISRARNLLFPISNDSVTSLAQLPESALNRNGTFYFNNSAAMQRGAEDFVKRWGNRKLEDNWRQSIRSNESNTQQILTSSAGLPHTNQIAINPGQTDSLILATYLASIPINQQMLESSNQKVVDAYFELASFYQQELKDAKEAAKIYLHLLKNYPQNNQLAAINYSLYLIYLESDPILAATYKQEVLRNHPNSVYAGTILDPKFNINQNSKDAARNNSYNTVFSLYEAKEFSKVIELADQHLATNAADPLAAQFAYLKAIAVGRTSPVDSLLQQFKIIKSQFPQDRLIVPLINDHLAYINQHLPEFKRRKIALIDFDPTEPRFTSQAVNKPQSSILNTNPITIDKPVATTEKPKTTPVTDAASGLFTKTASSTWYFVIDVADASIRLSSSRFGIGQFNRGNYPEGNLRHQLVEFDNDQLIYIGNFSSFEAVKDYQNRILPQLRNIMRVQPRIYDSFIITKAHFDLINSKSRLNQYLDFYKNNY